MFLGEHDVQCKDSYGLCQHRCGLKEHAESILHEADIGPSGAVEPDCAGEKSLLDLRLPAKEPVTLERISGEEPNAEPARGCESALSGDALSSAGMGKMPKNEYDA